MINNNNNLNPIIIKINTIKENGDLEIGLRKSDQRVSKKNSISSKQEEIENEIKCFQEIRYGKYVIAWKIRPKKMFLALAVQIIIGFLAILTTTGEPNTLPSVVSLLYLLYIFSSSKTQNTFKIYHWYTSAYDIIYYNLKDRQYCTMQYCTIVIALLKYILLPFIVPAMVVLDLVQVHRECISPQTLSFATADMVIITASINYASRSTDLSVAIPLLASFDFITKFSNKIAEDIVIDDDEAIEKARENDKWVLDHIFRGGILPILAMISIVTSAIVLAVLSTGMHNYMPNNK